MDKLNLTSRDVLGSNVEKIGELFPGVVTEAKDEVTGELKKVVDFDLLRQHLSDTLVEGDAERFRLDWPGKKASILKANTPIHKTLRPVREDSEEFDTTQNVFIEGDNFEVLKVLQESYLGKIKMIYIDPPYNTGKDFIYRDNFTQNREEYEEEIGIRDDENGGKLVKNTETNGRYHSDWLSMMQERLIVARDLLTDDGVIFISIDDNEQANLRKLADDVFGETNFVNQFTWVTNITGRQISGQGAAKTYESILTYCKFIDNVSEFKVDIEFAKKYMPDAYKGFKKDIRTDELGEYTVGDTLYNHNRIFNESTRPNLVFSIFYSPSTGDIISGDIGQDKGKDFIELLPHSNNDGVHKYHAWRWSRKKVDTESRDLIVLPTSKGGFEIYTRIRGFSQTLLKDLITNISNGDAEVKQLFDNRKYFDYPKSINLIQLLISSHGDKYNDLVLDFFSGSGTTAHATMELNARDGGSRKHIQIQLTEPTDKQSDTYLAGYKTIPEISRERIRRAAKKIREDYIEQIASRETPLDTGFRSYKLSSSNFTDTALHPNTTSQTVLLNVTDSIKEGRSSEDLLTEVILNLGLTLDLPIERKTITGHTVYFVGGNSLVACFDDTISLDIVEDIAAEKPMRVVFKDSSFASDEIRINIDIQIKRLSPDTTVQVI